ncbi:MAG TPA: family 10 glycosylhydrolase [Puia sp.]|nr:family 10 glycosylhydrolase [Puia sp.]
MKRFLLPLLSLLFSGIARSQPKYEFRAVWIATVDNIDWPSKGNFSTALQKEEFIRQLDMHKRNGMNAVIVQVRPACDAFFPSKLEPWSEWLTGKQGKAPVPYYDPLEFMIEETHKRGMEFHAWCNPYRAVFRVGKSSIAPNHVSKKHPDWILTYGDTRYLDPGNPQVQQYVVSVIRDMLHRYDIDAIHFDDYFYPYRIPGKEFPDHLSYQKYGHGMNREDWRRSNVDSVIVMLSRAIHEEKKTCKFGISPFGVWRNLSQDSLGSDTQAGQTNYDDLYADIMLWLRSGWIDYVVPQIYWEFEQKRAPFGVLLDWWNKHSYGRPCYIGIGYYKAGANSYWQDRNQLPRQIAATRQAENIQGQVYFSSTSFTRNPYGWNDSLQQHYYNYPALIAPMPWLDSTRPSPPVLQIMDSRDSLVFQFEKGDSTDKVRAFAIYRSEGPFPTDSAGNYRITTLPPVQVIPAGKQSRLVLLTADLRTHSTYHYLATAISSTNHESEPIPLYPVMVANLKYAAEGYEVLAKP